MSTSLCETKICRLCGEENPRCQRLFGEQGHLDELVTKICSYISIKVHNDLVMPHWLCPSCHLECESTETFLNLIRNGQRKLAEICKVSVEEGNEKVEPIKKKRGRKKKIDKELPVDQISSIPNIVQTGEHLKVQEQVATSPTMECKSNISRISTRLHRLPRRYQDCEMSKNGVSSENANPKKSSSKNEENKVALINSELIAQVRSFDGTSLGEIIEVNSSICRNTTRWVCDICKEVYQRESLFLSHIATHENFEYECTHCEQRFKTKDSFSCHQKSSEHIGMGIIEDFTSKEKSQNNQMQEETISPELSAVNIVIDTRGQISSIQSSQEPESSTVKYGTENVPMQPDCPDTLKSKFDCTKCGKTFLNKAAVKRHQKVHWTNRPFKCEFCSATFKSKYILKNHIASHLGKKEFACSICPKKFVMKHVLVAHQRTHTGEKPYECSHCNKRFSLRGNAIHHQKTHARSNSFKCKVCDATFTTLSQLQMHQKEHKEAVITIKKPGLLRSVKRNRLVCTYCGKAFIESFALTKHIRTHTGEKPYSCNLCPQKFSDPSNFRKHSLWHLKSKREQDGEYEDKTMREIRTLTAEQGIFIKSVLRDTDSHNMNLISAMTPGSSSDLATIDYELKSCSYTSFSPLPAISFSNELVLFKDSLV